MELRRGSGKLLGLVAIIALGLLLVWGFVIGRNQAAVEGDRFRAVKAPLRVTADNGATVITIDEETQRHSGITSDVLTATPHQQQIRAYGTVLDIARLTELSNRYASAQAQVQTAQAKVALSRMEFNRATKLYNDQRAVSEAQMQSAEAAFATDQANLMAAQAQARSLTAQAYQDWGSVIGKSLIDGSPTIERLIERQDFLLQITLPPGVMLAPAPLTASIESGKDTRAEITFVSPATHIDPKIQGISFFYVAPANSGVLPGMNVLAFLPTGKTVDGVTVPASAVVWWQNRAWVYQRTGPNKFVRVEIDTDLPAPGGGYIVGNMPGDVQIVTGGAQLLLSEEFRSQIQVDEDD
jgi:multidrug efflux pump subunit AcrA (membrane-fusion protein)